MLLVRMALCAQFGLQEIRLASLLLSSKMPEMLLMPFVVWTAELYVVEKRVLNCQLEDLLADAVVVVIAQEMAVRTVQMIS